MIGKSSRSTQGEACTCPTGTLCAECRNKKGVRVKPQIRVEGSSDLHVPIRITTYANSTPTTVQWLQKKSWNHFQKPVPIESANRGTKFCQWYRRCRARRKLKKLTRLERKRLENVRLEAARRIREAEFLELLKLKEKEIRYAEQELESIPKIDYSETEPKELKTKEKKIKTKEKKIKTKDEKVKTKEEKIKTKERKVKTKEKIPKIKVKKEKSPKIKVKKEKSPKIKEIKPKKTPKEKPLVCYCPDPDCVGFSGYQKVPKKRQKIKAAEAKPVSTSRYVATKAVKHPKDSINERFGSFCYRICCQCYCCVTFIIFIGFLIIFIF